MKTRKPKNKNFPQDKPARSRPAKPPRPERPAPEPEERNELQIEGRNAVMEALTSGRSIDRLFLLEGDDARIPPTFAALAKECGAVVVRVSRQKLDMMSETGAHQGVIALAAGCEYVSVEDMLSNAYEKGEKPLLVLCDHLEDPHNLGAIIRNAEVFGAHGVIIPKRRGAGVNATVVKASAGAVWHIPIARVPNLTTTIHELKKAGVWIFGADADGDTLPEQADFAGSTGIVIGAEGAGLSPLVRQNCDFIVSIPMAGKIGSLNASAAAAVLLYEALRKRTRL
jgi:23S rRNA (guanosine2251-2'-O)-methyltransferase